ncbi:MAG: PhoU family transcriptional regulator [Campylobacterales bacterium]|nr:PhoU family transcriptional regulator [Campylobacterales bacterium]
MLANYEEKKAGIKADIQAIGGCILNANAKALEALEKRDVAMFKKAKEELCDVSKKAHDIDNQVLTTLALFSPEANELRCLVSFFKITNELTRAASNTKNYIKLFSKHFDSEVDLEVVFQHTVPLHRATIGALQTALEMINFKEEEEISMKFTSVSVNESKTDDLYEVLEKSLFQLSQSDVDSAHDYFQILTAVRKLEKLGDRAVSIAQLFLFAKLGGEI